jgi:peptide/nickel transport system ATP-binding protein
MLKISNLSTWVKLEQRWLRAVDDISFTIEPGEVFGLIGESGCGKSMTALSIMRLLPASAAYVGESNVGLHGKNLIDLPEKDMRTIRGGDIAMIFQDPMTCLNPVLTIGTQITEVLSLHQRLKGRECYVEALRLLEAVRIPAAVHRFNSYPHELSGGMKQRVMIAMALAGKPSLLIADEPTTALDVTTQAQILSLIREIQKQQNMALLLITHDLAVAAQMVDTIAVMRGGKIVEQNTGERFFAGPKHAYSQQLLASLPQLFSFKGNVLKQQDENILEVVNLQVHFPVRTGILRRTTGYIKAVDGVSFNLRKGETLALVGESGCGKTTIGKALLALTETATGQVKYNGMDLLQLSQKKWRKIRSDLQIVFQDPFAALNPKLRIIDSLEEGLIVQGKYKSKTERVAKIDRLLEQVGLLSEHKWRFPHEFSGGERQRLCIARALTVEPKIIICDEPTSSLDVSVQAQVLGLLQTLQVEHDLTYLFITHDLAIVSLLAHRVAVMYLGRIVESGLTKDVLSSPKHPYTQALLDAVPKINEPQHNLSGVITGEIPSPLSPPIGCHFHPRCKFAKAVCRKVYPVATQISDTHMVKCVLYEQNLTAASS